VEHAEEAYQELRKAHVGANEDEKTVEQLDPGGKIRHAIEAHEENGEHTSSEAHAGGGSEHAEHK
jgi:hypothetical protein